MSTDGFDASARARLVRSQELSRRAHRGALETADIVIAVLAPTDDLLRVFAIGSFPTVLKNACMDVLAESEPDDRRIDTSLLDELSNHARGEAARRREPSVRPLHLLLAAARIGGSGDALLHGCGLDYDNLSVALDPDIENWG